MVYSPQYIAYGLFRGLHVLHENGFVHRDLKLENVVLHEEIAPRIDPHSSSEEYTATLKLIDYDTVLNLCGGNVPTNLTGGEGAPTPAGRSNATVAVVLPPSSSAAPQSGAGAMAPGTTPTIPAPPPSREKPPDHEFVVGTNQYIAPEGYLGQATAKTDVFAAGVILYRVITGRFPFREAIFDDRPGENVVGCPKMKQINVRLQYGIRNVDFSTDEVWTVKPTMADFVGRCLVYDHEDRISSAEALQHEWLVDFAQQHSQVSALAEFLGGEQLARFARPATTHEVVLSSRGSPSSGDQQGGLHGEEQSFLVESRLRQLSAPAAAADNVHKKSPTKNRNFSEFLPPGTSLTTMKRGTTATSSSASDAGNFSPSSTASPATSPESGSKQLSARSSKDDLISGSYPEEGDSAGEHNISALSSRAVSHDVPGGVNSSRVLAVPRTSSVSIEARTSSVSIGARTSSVSIGDPSSMSSAEEGMQLSGEGQQEIQLSGEGQQDLPQEQLMADLLVSLASHECANPYRAPPGFAHPETGEILTFQPEENRVEGWDSGEQEEWQPQEEQGESAEDVSDEENVDAGAPVVSSTTSFRYFHWRPELRIRRNSKYRELIRQQILDQQELGRRDQDARVYLGRRIGKFIPSASSEEVRSISLGGGPSERHEHLQEEGNPFFGFSVEGNRPDGIVSAPQPPPSWVNEGIIPARARTEGRSPIWEDKDTMGDADRMGLAGAQDEGEHPIGGSSSSDAKKIAEENVNDADGTSVPLPKLDTTASPRAKVDAPWEVEKGR